MGTEPKALLSTRVERVGDRAVLHLSGEIDMATTAVAQDALAEVAASRPEAVVLDLTPVTFFGSSGLRMLLKAVEEVDLPLALVAPRSGVVARTVALTGLGPVLKLVETVPAALERLSPPVRD